MLVAQYLHLKAVPCVFSIVSSTSNFHVASWLQVFSAYCITNITHIICIIFIFCKLIWLCAFCLHNITYTINAVHKHWMTECKQSTEKQCCHCYNRKPHWQFTRYLETCYSHPLYSSFVLLPTERCKHTSIHTHMRTNTFSWYSWIHLLVNIRLRSYICLLYTSRCV